MRSSKYSVRLLPVAEQDLQELVSYIAAEDVTAALSLAGKIEKGLNSLRSHPHLGKIPNDEKLAGLGYCVLVVENDLIFYKVRGKAVLVHRIVHGARDIPSLLMDI